MKNILIPPVFVAISLILIIIFYLTLPRLNFIPFPYNISGVIILITGFAIMGKAHDLFKKYKTTLYFNESSHLITDGIFSKSRNPMYIGMFLFLLGTAVCFMNLFSLITPFIFLTAVNLIFIKKEEKMMAEKFGDEYLRYKSRVKRWI